MTRQEMIELRRIEAKLYRMTLELNGYVRSLSAFGMTVEVSLNETDAFSIKATPSQERS